MENKSYVVEYERSLRADPEFSIISVYETYADVLEKYGILQIKHLLQDLMGSDEFVKYSDGAKQLFGWKAFDTVLSQGPGLGCYMTTRIHKAKALKTFCKYHRKEVAGLNSVLLKDPVKSYWKSIDYSARDLLQQGSFTPNHSEHIPMVPSTFTAYYGLQTELTESNIGISNQYWNMHSDFFAGERNLLTNNFPSHTLQGISSPYSYYYYGTEFTSFPHHFEDFWLPSVNFLYSGSEKYWISLPASDTERVWEAIEQVAKHYRVKADEKKFILSPQIIESTTGLKVAAEIHQMPGDVVISAAGATHGGFNLGPNLAEAVNFADARGEDGWKAMMDNVCEFYLEKREKSVPMALSQLAM